MYKNNLPPPPPISLSQIFKPNATMITMAAEMISMTVS